MSNLQNPIRIYDSTLTLVGEFDNYSSAYFTRTWHTCNGHFAIQFNANVEHADDFQKGYIVMFGKDVYRLGLITAIDKKLDERGKGGQIITASGYELKFIFSWRQVLPAAGSALYTVSNSAETVMKTLVKDQCGSSADADRKFTLLDVITDADRGSTYELSARYAPTVADELTKCSQSTGVGYFIYLDEANKKLKFDIGIGTDRTASQSTNPRAIFSDNFDSIKQAQYNISDDQYRNFAYVAGQGAGVDRTVREVYSGASEPTDFDRREMFVDARDLSATAALDARGAQKLTENSVQLTISGDPLTYSPLVYRTDYDLGDLVTIDVYDTPYDARVTEVKESWSPLKYEIAMIFDRQKADLPSQINKALETVKSSLNTTEGKTATAADASTIAARDSSGDLSARVLKSTVSTGTAPLTVSSTTKVNNLNADLLDGATTDTAGSANTIVQRTASGQVVGNTLGSDNSSGDEGGQIELAKPQTNTSLAAAVFVDLYQNALRIFESAGNLRGVYIDWDKVPSGISSELWHSGNDGSGSGLNADLHDGFHIKKLTGTTASTEGGDSSVAHGLTSTKIVGFTATVHYASGEGVANSYSRYPGYSFDCVYNSTDFTVYNDSTNSENILSKPFTILVWYEP